MSLCTEKLFAVMRIVIRIFLSVDPQLPKIMERWAAVVVKRSTTCCSHATAGCASFSVYFHNTCFSL